MPAIKLKASNAHRWVRCPGSAKLTAEAYRRVSYEPTDEARAGTCAHALASGWLKEGQAPVEVGQVGEAGVMVTEAMMHAASRYVGYVKHITAPGGELHIEEPVAALTIHEQLRQEYPDCWSLLGRVLHIFDFKYGLQPVAAESNWQCLIYAEGIRQTLGPGRVDTVVIHIVQPRIHPDAEEPAEVWVLNREQLAANVAYLRERAELATAEDARCIPTPEACRYCPARFFCPALQAAAWDAASFARQARIPPETTGSALGRELRELERAKSFLEARFAGVQEQALRRAQTGEAIAFYAVEPGRTQRKWRVPDAQIVELGDLLGTPLWQKKVITVAAAERAGIDESVINAYSERPAGKLRLVLSTNTQAKKVFNHD